MLETRCDHCGGAAGPEPQRWQQTIPSYESATFCADCHQKLVRRADERAHSDDDEQRIRGMTATLAGEVWSNADGFFWFRDPIVRRPRPASEPGPPTSTPTPAVAPAPQPGPAGKTKKAPTRSKAGAKRRR